MTYVGLNWQNFMHKLHQGALPKIFDYFFKNISNIYSYKTWFADNQNDFMQRVCTNSRKIVFLIDGLRSGKKSNNESENLALCHFLQTI